MRGDQPEISVLIPCLNEEQNVVNIVEAVTGELRALNATYEIIFIDNNSKDATIELIKNLCASDRRIKLIANNKNYGQMRSPTYGIYQTSGRAVLGISADFQDPPGLIKDMISRWRSGAKIVLGVRRTENAPILLKTIRTFGYWFFETFGEYRVIPGATGFGVYDQEVVRCLSKWRDPEPFFRGMLVESGFSIETIPYDRPARAGGRSKNNYRTIIAFGITALASCGKRLLRLPLYISLIFFLLFLACVLSAIFMKFGDHDITGPLIMALMAIIGALMFLFLGLIGEQVRLISEMVRGVPLVVERERVNFDGPAVQRSIANSESPGTLLK